MSYSDKVIDHYNNPRNVGSMDKSSADVGTGLVGAPDRAMDNYARVIEIQYGVDDSVWLPELASLRKPGSSMLEIPAAPAATATSTASAPQPPFPKSFEGCWEATVTQPEAWTFGRVTLAGLLESAEPIVRDEAAIVEA